MCLRAVVTASLGFAVVMVPQPSYADGPATQTVTEFSLPSGGTPLTITAGSDGNLWFVELRSPNYPHGALGKVTPAGQITEYPLSEYSGGVTAGSDGNVWVMSAENIERVTPQGQMTTFALPECCAQYSTLGPDGNVWFTENERDGVAGQGLPGRSDHSGCHGRCPRISVSCPRGLCSSRWTEPTLARPCP